LDATIIFLEQRVNHINLLVQFTKQQQLARQLGDSRSLSIVEKVALAPRTVSGLAHGMAHGGHIRHKNYEFTGAGGPAPASAFSHALDLCFRDLYPAVYDGHTLETTLSGSIPEFTYIGGQYPPSPPATAKSSTQEAK
jgi:hypothetical protein